MLKLFVFAMLAKPLLSPAFSAEEKSQQIDVKLFGQPCHLVGPLTKELLQKIHRLSPEQIYPDATPTYSEKLGSTLSNQLSSVQGAPEVAALSPSFARYREKLLRRLEAQVGFLNGFAQYKKTAKWSDFEKQIQKHLSPVQLKEFKKQLEAKVPAAELFETYNQHIEPEPEEEFHKALRDRSIQYQCSFDEVEGAEE